MALSINYNGSTIVNEGAEDVSLHLNTAGTYLEDDINIHAYVNTKTAFAPAITLASSTGVITGTNTFTSGYYAASTKTSTFNLTTKAAATYNTSTADQTIASNRWLTGVQTIKSVTTSNLTAANIKSGVTVKVGDANNASRITQVTGTYSETPTYTATIIAAGNSTNCYVQFNNTKYYTAGSTFTFKAGDTLVCYTTIGWSDATVGVYVDTEAISTAKGTYNYTLPAKDISIKLSYYDSPGGGSNSYSIVDIYTPIIPNAYIHGLTVANNVVTAPSGYYSSQLTGTVSTATAFAPAISLSDSTGVITGTNTFAKGYYTASTKTSTLTLSTFASSTWTPKTTSQTIARYQWLTGSQTIKGDSNLLSENIRSKITIFGVSGTWDGPPIYKSLYSRSTIANSDVVDFLTPPAGTNTILPAFAFAGVNIGTSLSVSSVWTVGSYAFFDNKSLTSVNFPRCIQFESSAFYRCSSLTTVVAPELTYLGQAAFRSCSKLTSVDFPKCTALASEVFWNCSSLTTVNLPKVDYVGYSAFQGCWHLTSAIFPSCTHVGGFAFEGCTSLSTISFPECTQIDQYAFMNCNSITIADFPKVTSVATSAFMSCTRLASAIFPLALQVNDYAFARCYSLSTLSFPICTKIQGYAFAYCSKIKSLPSTVFPALTSIGINAFSSCTNLSTADFPEALSIGAAAFFGCRRLETISFPKVVSVETDAFAECSYLSQVYMPEATYIGNEAFALSTMFNIDGSPITYWLYSLSLPKVQTISTAAFRNRYNLRTVSLPQLSALASSVFYNCRSMSQLYLLGSSVPTMQNRNCLSNTPMSNSTYLGYFGSIYVKESLATAFKSATNWAQYSSRIVGLTDAQISALG